jgi:hypothetical protein
MPQRNSYTFKEGLTMMAAKAIGIDPDLAAEAGDGARAAINTIRHAAKAKSPKERAALIRTAQLELRSINAAKHPKVINAIQARLLALQGRGGDTEVAHLTPGEVVIPRALQTPAVMRALATEAARQGIDTSRLSVGSPANSRNPRTGQQEFMEEIVVTGERPSPVNIPRVTNMPGSPWGRVGEPSDEMAAENIIRYAQSEGYFNPLSPMREHLETLSDSELYELKKTLENIKRLINLGGALDKVVVAGYAAALARFGIAIVFSPGGLVSLSLIGAVGVAHFVIDSVISIIDTILDSRSYNEAATTSSRVYQDP